MGLNKPVDFITAKLLKEKGFDKPLDDIFYSVYDIEDKSLMKNVHQSTLIKGKELFYHTPTIAEVVMWLYEKHGIWIQPYQTDDNNDAYPLFWGEINNRGKIIESTKFGNWFNSPTEAYEAAIKYTLENII